VWRIYPALRSTEYRRERCLTADPNVPLHGIPSSSLAPKLTSATPQDTEARHSGVELWLRRITVLMFVFVCATAGVFLVILPWRPEWTDNHLLYAHPALREFVANGFVRGLCTGLGVLDIWIGFWEAIHYHEVK